MKATNIASLASLTLALALAGCGSDPAPLTVNTAPGTVHGANSGAMRQFLGIPYAKPPVGDLRWAAPQPPVSFTGTRDATVFGEHCPQPNLAPTNYSPGGGSEDCLFLNVYTPKTSGSHAVMVWFHGGAFYFGRSEAYDPTRLIAKDVVVVTVNYRLGALGFLAHPALKDADGSSGNYGLLDQVAALQWVRANIAAFGGDPNNVTIFGQSAGGASVLSHLASTGVSAGLFHKAIVESGGYIFAGAGIPTGTAAQTSGAAVAADLFGCPNDANAATCLRALTVDKIILKQPVALTSNRPNIDGKFLTKDIKTALQAGTFNVVPVLEGSTHDEYTAFVGAYERALSGTVGAPLTATNYPSYVVVANGNNPKTPAQNNIVGVYPVANYGGSAPVAFAVAFTDGSFACNRRLEAKAISARGTVYSYEFNDQTAPQALIPIDPRFAYKAYHASEVQYLFTTPASQYLDTSGGLSASQETLATDMAGYWARFAVSGNPNAAGSSTWPAFDASERVLQLAPGASRVITSFATDHKCSEWTPGL